MFFVRNSHGLSAPLCSDLHELPYPRYREECLTAGANFFLDKSGRI